ncbi:MAG TPA: Dabb family protein [Chloroflexota bacterium]|jgi:hypothetical protein|nr:Dabb family protein [Chloroflexota bacterium]
MIEHIVLVRLPEEAQVHAEQIIRMFRDFKGVVPGLTDCVSGADFSRRCAPYSIAASLRFENREALDAYQVHPDHLALVKLLNHIGSQRMVADFEV